MPKFITRHLDSAKGGRSPDLAEALPAIKCMILGNVANHDMRMNLASRTDLRIPQDHRRRSETTSRTDAHRTADYNVRSYDRRGVDHRLRIDNGCWMNVHWPSQSLGKMILEFQLQNYRLLGVTTCVWICREVRWGMVRQTGIAVNLALRSSCGQDNAPKAGEVV